MTVLAPIVVFSHLRWDFVYQRPQHLISRLAATRRVVFVEEPVHRPGPPPTLELSRPMAGLVVVRPVLPVPTAGFDTGCTGIVADLLLGLLDDEEITDPAAWLYTPMALPLAEAIDPIAIAYDCMDELSLFLGAPPALIELEAELLRRADVMFTGGVSLYRAKRSRHPNVHCFPSSVDAAHFRRARRAAASLDEAGDQAGLRTPRLGFFGVIDERIDLDVLDALGRTRDWEVVMVGPVVKIDCASLPQHPNLHYVGQRTYDDLPRYLAGWDVCLLPFARNDATRFISPTKTLEYMAAERPIVSTPITDVAEPFGDVVYLADTPAAFVGACRRALTAPAAEREDRAERMRGVLARTSWDATAQAMGARLEEVITARPGRRMKRMAAGA